MPPYVQKESDLVDDGRYTFVPGVGRTRTGPRDREYWAARETNQRRERFLGEGGRRDDFVDQYRSRSPGRRHSSYDSYRPPHRSVSDGAPRGQHEPREDTKDEYDADDPTKFQHLHGIMSTFAEIQRTRSGHNGPNNTQPLNIYADPRRSTSRLPSREQYMSARHNAGAGKNTTPIKQETDDERIFVRDSSSTASTPTTIPTDQGSASTGRNTVDTASTTPIPPTPPVAAPRLPGNCLCPVDLNCPAREDHLIDCRTLVVEWKKWNVRRDEDAENLPADVETGQEQFASLTQTSRIIILLAKVNIHAAGSGLIKLTFNQTSQWINLMNTHSVRAGDLTTSNALPALRTFLSSPEVTTKRVPISIQEDLQVLVHKWTIGDLSQLPRRGVLRNSPRGMLHPDPEYPHLRSSKHFGHGDLVPGEKWLYRAAMARDGAHGPLIAGISGTAKHGAYSIVMGCHDIYKQEYYADVDCGETIFYIGTALPKPRDDEGNETDVPTNIKDDEENLGIFDASGANATSGSKALTKSHETGTPVRVFRSFRAAKIVPLRPKQGYRYDGLYKVVDYELLKAERQIYRFKMERLRGMEGEYGQGPLRGA